MSWSGLPDAEPLELPPHSVHAVHGLQKTCVEQAVPDRKAIPAEEVRLADVPTSIPDPQSLSLRSLLRSREAQSRVVCCCPSLRSKNSKARLRASTDCRSLRSSDAP